MATHRESWEQFLTPDIVRDKLIGASLYITAYEVLKDSIIGRLRSFFADGYDKSGPTVGPEYHAEVLASKKHVLAGSIDWLLKHDVIDAVDVQSFDRITETRNDLAHRLHSLVLGNAEFKHVERFPELVSLLRKIEVWWVVNVEVPTNPDFDGREIDEAGISPGPVLMLQLMLDVVAGNEEFLKHFRK